MLTKLESKISAPRRGGRSTLDSAAEPSCIVDGRRRSLARAGPGRARAAGRRASPASPGGGAGRGATPVVYGDYSGFTNLWDGQTLDGWEGETDVWSIDNGAIHANTTKTPGQHHLHYKGPGAVMRDFDLKVEFKISATGANGGSSTEPPADGAAQRFD